MGVVMVNNVNNNGVAGSKAAAYQQKNQQVEQAKANTVSQQEAAPAKAANVAKDSVALTPQANQLKELQKRIGDADSFDRKKVDDIKKAIADGEYQINYDKLASKLAAFEFEL